MAAVASSSSEPAIPANFNMKPQTNTHLVRKFISLALGLTAAGATAGTFGSLPLYFEAGSPTSFLAQGSDAQFSISTAGAQLVLEKSGTPRTVQMQFTGANPQPEIHGDAPLSGKINHLTGSQPEQWRAGVPTFARVQVTEIYPGIDLVYYGSQQRLGI